MLKQLRFIFSPVIIKHSICPIASPPPLQNIVQSQISDEELCKGLSRAYFLLMHDYSRPTTEFKKKHYLTPKLSIALDIFHMSREIVPIGEIQSITLVNKRVVHEYTEYQDKYAGYYSSREIIEQLIAGFCGPESPLWIKIPRKEQMRVLYTTNTRMDVIDFERDMETDGDWVICNINKII